MRWVRRLVTVFAVLLGLAVAAGSGLWIWKPWVPSLDLVEPGSTGRRIAEAGVFANYFPAPAATSSGAVLILGGSEGGLGNGGRRMALELQKAGYAVLQAAYYRAPGQPPNLELVPLEAFDRALAWLGRQPGVTPDRIAVIGISKGAEAALLVATRHPELRAVVAGVPSSVVWAAINWEYGGGGIESSWSHGGKPVPALAYGAYDWDQGVYSVYKNGLGALAQHPETIIPVEKALAPLMLICGEADALWPSCEMARQVESRARAQGGPAVELHAYKDAGHAAIGVPVPKSNPNYERLGSLGGTPEGNAQAREDGWPKIIAFLKANLAPPQPAPPN